MNDDTVIQFNDDTVIQFGDDFDFDTIDHPYEAAELVLDAAA